MLRMPTAMNGRPRDLKSLKAVMLVAVMIIAAITAISVVDSESPDADTVTMTLSKNETTIYRNASPYSDDIVATISAVNTGDNIQITSSNSEIADGTASAISSEKKSTITVTSASKTGTATLTVKLMNGDTLITSKTITVKVKAAATSVDIQKNGMKISSLTINTGKEDTVSAKVNPSDAPQSVKWTSSDDSIASVDNGKITAKKAGEVTIKATSTEFTSVKPAELKVTVKDIHVSSVTVDPKETSVKMLHQVTLTATILPADATNKDVDITTDKPTLIEVKSKSISDNKITIVLEGKPADAPGTATITITTKDGGKTATSTVKVERIAVTGVELTEETGEIEVDDELELTYKVTPPDATNPKVTWTSSNSSVATVNEDGVVKAVSPGTATITVTTVEGNFTDTCEITVPKTITIIGFVDASGNVLGTDDLIKSIDKAAARSLYPVLALVDIAGNTVNMSSDIVRALQKAKGGSMDISTPLGEAYFDENAIDRVDVTGKTAGITFTQIPSETYPKFGECYVYDISMTKDGAKVPTNFGSCGPKIGIYHELGETEDVSKLKVAFVYGDGDAIMLRNYAYVEDEDNSAVVFEPPHMSTFMYMFHDSEYISTDSFDVVFVALFLVLVLALGGGVAFLEFHPVASEKFMNLFDNPNKPPKRPRFPGRSRKNEYDDYYNNDYYR